MKAAVYIHSTRRSATSPQMIAIAEGLRAHGVKVHEFPKYPTERADFAVVWGERKRIGLKARGFNNPILVAERGYFDRFVWTSLGWNGLNGRAGFNGVWDESRFETNFSSNLKPWRGDSKGYALIMGQVRGDMSLVNVNIDQWYSDTATALWKQGWDVRFRPHPESEKKRLMGKAGHERPRVPFAAVSEGSLDDALSGAALVLAWNSNALVDAVMAGVPIYAGDRGSMVYDLASRDFNPVYPEREKRLNEIANVQWTIEEIESGKAWEIVKEAM